jgi:hypothetical protein
MRATFVWCLIAAAWAAAPAWGEPADRTPVTLTGEIVDPGLYLREGARGTPEQTYDAVDGGQSLALLEQNGRLYLLLAERPGEDPNELFYDHVGQSVRITGRVYERGGVLGLVAESVEPIGPGPEAAD